jgi:hypothetical protein
MNTNMRRMEWGGEVLQLKPKFLQKQKEEGGDRRG